MCRNHVEINLCGVPTSVIMHAVIFWIVTPVVPEAIHGKSYVPTGFPTSAVQYPCHTRCNVCGTNLITGLTSVASPRGEISSTCKVKQKLGVSLPLLTCSPSGVTIRATVPQRSEILEGLMNYPV